eukprot:PhM_4_TR6175/c0_g1_i3/m.48087
MHQQAPHQRQAQAPVPNNYELCPFTTEAVLSFSVDRTQVCVISRRYKPRNPWGFDSDPKTCLVVDDTPDSEAVARTYWFSNAPPEHYNFEPMCFRRALDWLKQWNCDDRANLKSFSLGKRCTESAVPFHLENDDIAALTKYFRWRAWEQRHPWFYHPRSSHC